MQTERSTRNREYVPVISSCFSLVAVMQIRRPGVMPRPGRFRAVESGVAPASLSPGIGAFYVSSLPGRMRRRQHLLDSHALKHADLMAQSQVFQLEVNT